MGPGIDGMPQLPHGRFRQGVGSPQLCDKLVACADPAERVRRLHMSSFKLVVRKLYRGLDSDADHVRGLRYGVVDGLRQLDSLPLQLALPFDGFLSS